MLKYKIIIQAPSVGGKSTLMRYLREHTDLEIAEMDEKIIRANNNQWPTDGKYKDQVLVPKITREIMKMDKVIYLASYVPTEQLREARNHGFTSVLLKLNINQLTARNAKRVEEEGYKDATPWRDIQLETYDKLAKEGLIDKTIDGNQPTSKIAEEVIKLAQG